MPIIPPFSRLVHPTLEEWAAGAALPFDPASPASLAAAFDPLLAALPDTQLLGLGEPTHRVDLFLTIRNCIFQHLALHHGYSAIAIESSFPRSVRINDFVHGRTGDSFDAVQNAGFSHNFGRMRPNEELAQWMRQHNADPNHLPLRFYGFDAPTEMSHADSPKQALSVALTFLAPHDQPAAAAYRERIDPLLGDDAAWENPTAMYDPAKSIGLWPAATALRALTEDLIAHLQTHRPALIDRTSRDDFLLALQHAITARHLLTYHALMATAHPDRYGRLLAFRDTIMADTLLAMMDREAPRGKVFAFAHNTHLQRGQASWTFGQHRLTWWPAGAHLAEALGPRYAAIASAAGTCAALNLRTPDPGSLESLFPQKDTLIPTATAPSVASLPKRTSPPTYSPLTANHLTNFDALLIVNS